ncbi:hypothetical protein ACFFLS_04410 [Flavobacterium procerum]|uniref:Lipoprotein n=1 Tax=Flavobacterium procerum TaxID=1455569 RepID=A0ABV6BLF0_9FLAO
MMKRLLSIVFVTSLFLSCQNKAPEKFQIDEITFSYLGGLRIPYNTVTVYIRKEYTDSARVIVQSRPLFETPEWRDTKIDTMLKIDVATFEKFATTTESFDKINIEKADLSGIDGSTWKIEYGAKGKNKSYHFWSPNSETKKRGLEDFVTLSEDILAVSKLDKKKILED